MDPCDVAWESWKYHLISKILHRRFFIDRTGASRLSGGMGINRTRLFSLSLHRLWREVLAVGLSLLTAIMWLRNACWSPIAEQISRSLHPRVSSPARFLSLSSNLSKRILLRWWRGTSLHKATSLSTGDPLTFRIVGSDYCLGATWIISQGIQAPQGSG